MIELRMCIDHLNQRAQAIQQLAGMATQEQARWKPIPETWSILEVVNHLGDEENADFRSRLKHILDQIPGLPPPNDPQRWVTERRYNERELQPSLDRFMRERAESLGWLRTLTSPDWDLAVEGPFGRITAGDMLMAWVAHDLLHLRQLVELHYAYHQQQAQPYSVAYAGEW